VNIKTHHSFALHQITSTHQFVSTPTPDKHQDTRNSNTRENQFVVSVIHFNIFEHHQRKKEPASSR
jgi:hypothetical protein